jgi:iron-sulfur cluster assembly accessory protein
MNVTITPAAERFISRMLRMGGDPKAGFRLQVSPGGCSGLSSEFEVEAAPRAGDAVCRVGGVTLFLPAESRLLLEGATIDFVDTPTQTGFVITDSKSGCGCTSAGASEATMATQH